MPINDLSSAQLLEAVQAVVDRGAIEVAKKLSQRLNAIYSFAIVRNYVVINRAENLCAEIPDFIRSVIYSTISDVVKIALLFTFHTLSRTSETRFAKWSEFDMDNKLWHIPAERMKMGRPHIVPLSEQVITLLEHLKKVKGTGTYLFTTHTKRKPMSENAMLYATYRLGYKGRLTVHGLRGTGSTILNEEGFRAEVIETALAHTEQNKVRKAYNHALYLDERRDMLNWYSNHIESLYPQIKTWLS